MNISGATGLYMLVNGTKVVGMVLANINGKMGDLTKEYGMKIICKVSEYKNGLIRASIPENT